MKLARWRNGGSSPDEGSTQIILLAAMVCAFGLTLLALQVAQAGDLRSRAQNAADASAIGSLVPLRDAAVTMAQTGIDPTGIGLWAVAPNITVADPVYNRSARHYADRNQADLAGKVHVTGVAGATMKVEVLTQECQALTKDEQNDPRFKNAQSCRDRNGKPFKGLKYRATAIAQLRLPSCGWRYGTATPGPADGGNPIPVELDCAGTPVWKIGGWSASREVMIRLFKIRLVAHEDAQPYTGVPSFPGGGPMPAPGPLPPGTPEQVKRAIAFAASKIGLPYLWGGTGPLYDCSGLMMRAWQYAGINIPRVSQDQWRWARPIPAGQERPGDLVFFEGRPPGHVGMVVDPARHQMIESPHTGAFVRYSSYQRGNLVGFGRVYNG